MSEISVETTRTSSTQIRHDGRSASVLSHRLRATVIAGPHRGAECQVVGRSLTIGASSDNQLVMGGDALVSGHHCEIVVRNNEYVLRDLASTNGTFVEETKVIEAVIAPGARLRLGDSEILFEPKQRWERVEASERESFGALLGRAPIMRELFGLLERLAQSELTCLLLGETGTGKELAARGLHAESERASGPFVVVDCGAVSESLVESELFGHEKGAFTGADRQRRGAFELAHGGTVFLDEIGELPLRLQPKLLRVLESREFKRLGGSDNVRVDVRVIAATHRNLERMAQQGELRSDLYYRLAEAVVRLPPLRERREDVEHLAQHFVRQEGRGRIVGLSEDATRRLAQHDWPGNARELRNLVRRGSTLARGPLLEERDLELSSGRAPGAAAGFDRAWLDLPIRNAREHWIALLEREYLAGLLERHGGDVRRCAEAAGLHEKSLRRLLVRHELLE